MYILYTKYCYNHVTSNVDLSNVAYTFNDSSVSSVSDIFYDDFSMYNMMLH